MYNDEIYIIFDLQKASYYETLNVLYVLEFNKNKCSNTYQIQQYLLIILIMFT